MLNFYNIQGFYHKKIYVKTSTTFNAMIRILLKGSQKQEVKVLLTEVLYQKKYIKFHQVCTCILHMCVYHTLKLQERSLLYRLCTMSEIETEQK